MINTIRLLHNELKKGQCLKIALIGDYTTFVSRADELEVINSYVLVINKKNGARVVINNDYIIMCNVIEKWMV